MLNDFVDCRLYRFFMGEKEEIGRRLALARNNKDLTLEAVCEKVPGLIKSTLHAYERGARTLPIRRAKELAPIYGVSATYLLTLSDDPAEDLLLQKYRQADARGKENIQRTARAESPDVGESDLAA